jgi:hypothetical protein
VSAKHYQVLIIYIYTAYISLAFNKYSILTLSHTINDQGERPDRHHLWTETCQLHVQPLLFMPQTTNSESIKQRII